MTDMSHTNPPPAEATPVTAAALAERLRTHPSIRSKLAIAETTQALGLTAQTQGAPGDDAALLPRADGYDLFAGEGFIPAFVADDPWFAGWCGVMVNLSDIAAMGGRASALLDQVWAPDAASAAPLLAGLRAAAEAYGVPLVGGHTNLNAPELGLAVSVLGHARTPIRASTARPGDVLIAAVDHRGSYRNFDNFCAAFERGAGRLATDLDILPTVAEAGLVSAGKDISQGGIPGTALMLAESSGCGLRLDLDAITPPPGIDLARWLVSFPSFGFLLTCAPETCTPLLEQFHARDLHAAPIGTVTSGSQITFADTTGTALFWDHAQSPYLGLTPEIPHA